MIKKLKLGLLIAVLSLAVGVGSANAANINFTDNTIVNIPAVGNFTILGGSVADSVVVSATQIVVGVTAPGPFTLTSPDGFTLGQSSGTATCSNSTTSSTITTTTTVTFTPTTSIACVVSGSGGLSSGGGGGSTPTTGDTTAPTGSVSINGGASLTSSLAVTLTLTTNDATQIMISNDSAFTGSVWESFVATKPWLLSSGDGAKTVFVKFRDANSNISAPVMATINVLGSGTVPAMVQTIPGCSTGNLYSTSSGLPCSSVSVPILVIIAGCGNTNTGFSSVTGQSCANNMIVVSTVIPGCDSRVTGFSTVNGQSCVGNFVGVTFYAFGTVTLRSGSKGAAVMELQRFLNRFLSISLVVDGAFGPKTKAKVVAWQAAHGLVADGIVGPKTKAAMNAQAAIGY